MLDLGLSNHCASAIRQDAAILYGQWEQASIPGCPQIPAPRSDAETTCLETLP